MNNQGLSDLVLGNGGNGMLISDLFVIDAPISSPYTWVANPSRPEVDALYEGTYFFDN